MILSLSVVVQVIVPSAAGRPLTEWLHVHFPLALGSVVLQDGVVHSGRDVSGYTCTSFFSGQLCHSRRCCT